MDIYVTTTKCQAFYVGHFILVSPLYGITSLTPRFKDVKCSVSEIKQIKVLNFT